MLPKCHRADAIVVDDPDDPPLEHQGFMNPSGSEILLERHIGKSIKPFVPLLCILSSIAHSILFFKLFIISQVLDGKDCNQLYRLFITILI